MPAFDPDRHLIEKLCSDLESFQHLQRQIDVRARFKGRADANERILRQQRQCKEQPGDELRRDVAVDLIRTGAQDSFDLDGICGMFKAQALCVKDRFIDILRTL